MTEVTRIIEAVAAGRASSTSDLLPLIDQGLPTRAGLLRDGLVTGLAIIEFCDDRRTTIEKRIEIFVDLYEAIQHADQKGVVHRDLKPSNILVCSKYGGFGHAAAPQHECMGKFPNHLRNCPGVVSHTLAYAFVPQLAVDEQIGCS